MTDDADVAAIEAELQTKTLAHRAFFVPIARAISQLGGNARRRDVQKKLRELLKHALNDKQLDYLESNNRYGWARREMKEQGLIDGAYGYWQLTGLGIAYEAKHAEDELLVELDIPEAQTSAASAVKTESVPVTGFVGYELPLLEVMSKGLTVKKEIIKQLGDHLKGALLPGDYRLMPSGMPVWTFRSHWAISNLGKDGHIENVSTGVWSITSSGRERLVSERDSWNIKEFQSSHAKVRVEGSVGGRAPEPPTWPTTAWAKFVKLLPKAIAAQLEARLRPDLGPSPDIPLARNLVLYGPPGTGKTYLAKQLATALVGQEDVSEDGHFRLLQFHPSYAYEDFVQGLRPDLKQTQLRYQLQKGPFVRIAEAAAQEPDSFFVLVIDEINRGDPARIFGELLYALEYRDENVTLPLGGELRVPSNLIIIGTMNSVDRSVALVDYALRRRFGFMRVDPDPDIIGKVRGDGLLADVGPEVLENLNKWLCKRLGREHAIGHSFFISPTIPDDAPDALDRLWSTDIRPLLEEYFFGDEDGLIEASAQWHSIVNSALKAREEVHAEANEEAPPV